MNKIGLLSVYDKSGLAQLGKGLVELGWQLVASGGTAAALRQAGLEVTNISTITGAPEMLGGRVKTLHPAIHGGILAQNTAADMAELASHGIQAIDLVICNLYPFQQTVADPAVTLADAVEQIDIGGVTLLRAAAKNFARVTVVCQPEIYPSLLASLADGTLDLDQRRRLALQAFIHTREYDTAIASYLEGIDRLG